MPIQKITSGIIQDGAVAAADIVSVSNTAISGLITASQIAAVNGSVITANTIANSAIQTGAVENYMSAQGLGFGMRNRIINGAMVIDQRNAGAALTSSSGYGVDRFYFSKFATDELAWSIQQDTSAPAGFINSQKVTITTAETSLTTNENVTLGQVIEGLNIADLNWGTANAKTVTLSFWVRSSLTGTFGGALFNSATDRFYPFSYTILAANTWEYETITITGDTSGTWLTTNGAGIYVQWGLGQGPDRLGTAGAWTASNNQGVTGQVQLASNLNATWQVTGVQLEKGSTATSFDYRSYQTELSMCQRYYTKSFAPGTVPANGTNGTTITTTIGAYSFTISRPNGGPTVTDSTNLSTSGSPIVFPVQMRASPSITQYGNSSGQWWYRDVGGANTGWAAFTGSVFYTADRFLPNFSSIIDVDKWAHAVGHWVASSEL